MSQRFVKGRTNNHLTWVMVDATDFATPESALSAATKIKIYGKRDGAADAAFITSGTGSLTNDIKHIGASALGMYTIALVKADLSDASAAWYNQYEISLSATGAAYQTLIVDGGIETSALLALGQYLSNMASNLSGVHSDTYSLLSDLNSNILSRVPKAVATNSQLSDLASDLRSYLVGMSGAISDAHSAAILAASHASDAHSMATLNMAAIVANLSLLSDIDSALTSQYSDLASKIGEVGGGTITPSDISDIASAVWAFGTRTTSLEASDLSDLRSAIAAGPTTYGSDISDILSAVRGNSDAISNVQSYLVLMSGMLSDAHSAAILAASHASNAHSMAAANSNVLSYASGVLSDLESRITGAVATASDVASKVWAEKYTAASNVKASTFGSALRLSLSRISDIDSALTSQYSDLASKIGNVSVALTASDISDIASAVAAAVTTVTASDISDIASAVWGYSGRTASLDASDMSDLRSAIAAGPTTYGSDISDILSAVRGNSGAISNVQSYLVLMSGMLSDAHSAAILAASHASDAHSMATLNMAAIVANLSMLSDIDSALTSQHSDLASKIGNVSVALTASDISDIASAVAAAVTTVTASDISDIASAVWGYSGRTASLDASDMSDLRSAITAGGGGVTASDISDIASAVWAHGTRTASLDASDMSDLRSAIAAGPTTYGSDISDILSGIRANASMLSDVDSALSSQFTANSATLSDILSAASNVNSMLTGTRAEPGQGAPGATIDALTKLDYLYKAWRNKSTQTADTYSLYADDGTTVDQKATVSDDTITAVKGEVTTGP